MTASSPARRKVTPLVPEFEATYYASLAKTVALCHSLRKAHAESQWRGGGIGREKSAAKGSRGAVPMSTNYSRKLREAIMFSSCGSHEANRIPVPEPPEIPGKQRKLNLGNAYVDRYIDEWTEGGAPHMWETKRWQRTISPKPLSPLQIEVRRSVRRSRSRQKRRSPPR